MKPKEQWKEISDKDKIIVGTLIQGYTYSSGDYHNDPKRIPKKFLGNPKLRKGIVVDVFSNKILKVQFWNSAFKEYSISKSVKKK